MEREKVWRRYKSSMVVVSEDGDVRHFITKKAVSVPEGGILGYDQDIGEDIMYEEVMQSCFPGWGKMEREGVEIERESPKWNAKIAESGINGGQIERESKKVNAKIEREYGGGIEREKEKRNANIEREKVVAGRRGTGEMNSNFTGWYVVDGVQYPSSGLAALVTGRSKGTIIRWCNSGRNGCSFIPKGLPH